ncbi:MAG: DMT family transporter [Cellulosilyticum sp.]|nr:DMT family transporter [Cellulosilyticum sp.]
MMNYLLSLIAGLLLAFMVSSNGIVGEAAGNYASSVIIHFIGLVAVIAVLLIRKAKFKNLRQLPLWMYSAGLIGIITVLFNNLTFTALGVSLTVALGLLGQSITSIIIDHFGLFGLPVSRFNTKKIVGFMIILFGIIIMALPV